MKVKHLNLMENTIVHKIDTEQVQGVIEIETKNGQRFNVSETDDGSIELMYKGDDSGWLGRMFAMPVSGNVLMIGVAGR